MSCRKVVLFIENSISAMDMYATQRVNPSISRSETVCRARSAYSIPFLSFLAKINADYVREHYYAVEAVSALYGGFVAVHEACQGA